MKRPVKEDNYRGEWLALALEYSEKAFDYLKRAASVADKAGYSNFVEELKSYADGVENTLYDLRNVVDGLSKEDPVSESLDESGSDEETEWFDSNGDMKRHLPKDCILDCSSGGSVDDSVDYWVKKLNFKVPVDRGLSYVREYGLDDISPEEVDKYVLWIMCGNIKEDAYEFCRDGSDWEYVDRESYPDEMDNWNDDDWDRFQEEACVCHLGM